MVIFIWHTKPETNDNSAGRAMKSFSASFQCTIFCLLFLLAESGSAQSPINATILNPTGFLAPGESVDILVEIENPQGSGITITGISNFNFWSNLEISGELTRSETFPLYPNPSLCGSERQCLSSGSFPLLPGASAVIAVKAIRPDDVLAVGKALTMEFMRLQLQTGGIFGQDGILLGFRQEEILLGGMAAYIVSQDGSGDAAVFNQYAIEAEVPPVQEPQLSIRFNYPDSIPAGSNFNLTATIVNQGSQPIARVSPSFFFPFFVDAQSPGPEGSHADSYHVARCTSNCQVRGKFPLQPGASAEFDISNFYYQNEKLFSGDLRPLLPAFSSSDFYFRPSSTSIEPARFIQITSSRPGETPNPQEFLPSRQAVELIQSNSEMAPDIIFDPNTGYEWLRIAETVGMPLSQVLAKTAEGGRYEGFELASSSQVDTLLLNQLHASGIPAAAFALREPNTDVNDALYWIIDALGQARSPFAFVFFNGSSASTAGLVKDSAIFDEAIDGFTYVEISADAPAGNGFSSPRGRNLRSFGLPLNLFAPSGEPAWGYWMVRTNAAQEFLVLNRARFVDGELILPAVELGSEQLAVRMRFGNELTNFLQVISSSPPEIDFAIATFDEESRYLSIPEVDVPLGNDMTDVYRLRLRYLDDAQLPTVELIEAELIKQCVDEVIETPTEIPGLRSLSVTRNCEPVQ